VKPDDPPPLSIALSSNPSTRPLIDGAVTAEGIDLTVTVVHPPEMFWRQLRFAEFDVSEMSSLLMSTARGPTPWVALPVYSTREFFHTRILVRADAPRTVCYQWEIIQGRLAGKLLEPSLLRVALRANLPEQQAHPVP
jgi:hypothetical protein